jgi:hypothetical protein
MSEEEFLQSIKEILEEFTTTHAQVSAMITQALAQKDLSLEETRSLLEKIVFILR